MEWRCTKNFKVVKCILIPAGLFHRDDIMQKYRQLSKSTAVRQELEQQSRTAFSILHLQSPPLLP